MREIILSLLVVGGIAGGQILFKVAAGSGSIMQILWSPFFWGGAIIYGSVTVAWVLLLRDLGLARAYPITAAAYVIVPVASALIFGEKFGPVAGLGLIFIAVGIVLSRFG
jgi:drug/metabolite transporter (DMT)-like permease